MLFNSLQYFAFFPFVVLIYFIIPNKIKQFWLLVASYYFYMCWNAKYIVLLLFCTIVTYCCGLLLERTKLKKAVIFIGLVINLGILFYFKYTNFALLNIQRFFQFLQIDISFPAFDVILPVGISFFIFQALGYMIDVYRGDMKAEKNFFRYALFVSFFPQLVAGPIERSKNILPQLKTPSEFEVQRVKSGLLTMAYGLFIKIAAADNIALIIDPVFDSPSGHSGMELLSAVILFAFQIYCDFEGYTKIAIGSAEVLGYRLNENFHAPYMAVSVKDFWRRWHISLTSWFTDYLYIPLGGNRKGKIKKAINMMIVFLCSGLWHGAAWHYVVWGALNGFLCILEDACMPVWKKIKSFLKIKDSPAYAIFCIAATFAAIDITWLFFRIPSLNTGIEILKKIIADFRWEWFLYGGYTELFSDAKTLMIVILSLIIIQSVDLAKCMGKDIKAIIFKQQIVFRWIIYWTLLMMILYWGIYGNNYEQTQFIYFQF